MALLRRQSGTVTISGTSTTATVSIYDPNASILLFTYNGGDESPTSSSILAEKTNSTTLTFSRNAIGGINISINWELLEFDNTILVQNFIVTPTSGTVNQTINAVDLQKSFIIPLGNKISGVSFGVDNFIKYTFTSSTNVLCQTNSASSGTFAFQVVQYKNCNVQSFNVGSKNTTSWTQTISSVNINKTILLSSCSFSANIQVRDLYSLTLTNNTTVTASRFSSILRPSCNISLFVVSFTDNTSIQYGELTLTGLSNTATIINQPIYRSSIMFSGIGYLGITYGYADIASDSVVDVAHAAILTNETTLSITRASSTASSTVNWQVINWDTSSTSSGSAGTNTLSYTHMLGTGSNKILLVGISTKGSNPTNSTVTTCSFNGVNMTQACTIASSNSGLNVRATIYYMLEELLPSPGPYTISITTTNAISVVSGSVSMDEIIAVENTVTNRLNSSGNTMSTNIETLNNSSVIFDHVGGDINTLGAPASPQLECYDLSNNNACAQGSTKITSFSGLQSMSWTWANPPNRRVHAILAITPTSEIITDAIFMGHNI